MACEFRIYCWFLVTYYSCICLFACRPSGQCRLWLNACDPAGSLCQSGSLAPYILFLDLPHPNCGHSSPLRHYWPIAQAVESVLFSCAVLLLKYWMDKATTTNSSIFLGRLILNSGSSWMVFRQEVVLHKWIWQEKWWLLLLGERTSIGLCLGLYCWFSLELTFCSLCRGSGIFQTPTNGCLALIHSGASTVLTEKMEK